MHAGTTTNSANAISPPEKHRFPTLVPSVGGLGDRESDPAKTRPAPSRLRSEVNGHMSTACKIPKQPTMPPVQGVWSTSGPTAADLLRASNKEADIGQSLVQLGGISTGESSVGGAPPLSVVPLTAESVGALVEMGIDEATAAAALRRCGGSDVTRALDFCFSHDMDPLVEEDSRSVAAAPQDIDTDMAFAMALEQEERRAFEARRRAAAAGLSVDGSALGSKIQIGGAPVAPAASGSSVGKGRKWGAADAENMKSSVVLGGERGDGDDEVCGGLGFDQGSVKGAEPGEDDLEEEFVAVPGGGRRKGKMPLFRNADGEVVSKHDAVICGRMNARDASKLDGVGDLSTAGVRLDNRTYNSLKRDIRKKQEKGMTGGTRVEGATRSTQEGVMDTHTRLLVYKMVNAGTLAEVHGMVKTGKEAHVYHAAAPVDPEQPSGQSRDVAIKIFKTTLNEFGNRAAYVDGDPRYANIKFNKQSRRKMFSLWAKKEHRNLIRMHRAGLSCPEPILQREHVLIMSFVGSDHWPAPQLRELNLSKTNWRRCYGQVLELVRAMYQRCRLVHADLSEYNVLYHQKVCHMIDVGQAVDVGHAKSREYLSRDISGVSDFFRRQGVDGCLDLALAEKFVLDYNGPFEYDHGNKPSEEYLDAENAPPTGLRLLSELMDTTANNVESLLRSFCDMTSLAHSGNNETGQEQEYVDDDEDGISDEDIDDGDDGVEVEGLRVGVHELGVHNGSGSGDGEEHEGEERQCAGPGGGDWGGVPAFVSGEGSSLSGSEILINGGKVACASSSAQRVPPEEEVVGHGWEMVSDEDALQGGFVGEDTLGGSALRAGSQRNMEDVGGGRKAVRRENEITGKASTIIEDKVELGERERARTADAKERLKAGIFVYDS